MPRKFRDAVLAVEMTPEYVIRKGERYYLLPPFLKVLDDKVIDISDKGFATFVAKYSNEYMQGKTVPVEIQAPIGNAVEDFLAGRNIVFRAGDYIALQTQFKKEMGH